MIEISHTERVNYEKRILAAEMDTALVSCREATLRSLIRLPEDRGGYKGDCFYPVGGTVASHEWDGDKWIWLV